MSIDLFRSVNSNIESSLALFNDLLNLHLKEIDRKENELKQIENAYFSSKSENDRCSDERKITVLDKRTISLSTADKIEVIEKFSQLIIRCQSLIQMVTESTKKMEFQVLKAKESFPKEVIEGTARWEGAEAVIGQFKKLDERLQKEWDPALKSFWNNADTLNKTAATWLEQNQIVLNGLRRGLI